MRFPRPSDLRELTKDVHGFNAKLAVVVSNALGSMVCAYCFSFLALLSLPAILYAAHVIGKPGALASAGLILLVSWLAQTYIQLVSLSVLQVSNNATGIAQEANTKILLADAETTRALAVKLEEAQAILIDAMDTKTEGGLKEILDAIGKSK